MFHRMQHRIHTLLFLAAPLAATVVHAATGIPWIDSNTNLTVNAEIRLRYEVDWDSKDAAGVERDDRHRVRRIVGAELGAFKGKIGSISR